MAYNLYTDKPNKFNCNIDVEGTSLSNSKVRLVIETNEMSYMFNGHIENTGVCEVNIPKTKNFLPEGTKGNIKLEVIADDVYFEPWNSDFNVKTSKKVNCAKSQIIKVVINADNQIITPPSLGVPTSFSLCKELKTVASLPSSVTVLAFFFHILFL